MRIEDEIKQPTFRDEYQKAIINLVYTTGWLQLRQATAFKTFGLTLPQFNILRILRGQHPLPATVALLIDRMLDKTSNASRIVDRLEEKKLVTRTVCPANRRAVDIRITPAGLELLKTIEDSGLMEKNGTQFLTPDEARQLNALLDKIRTEDGDGATLHQPSCE
ncbi:MarR family winged helix-turn-helix transcriptional regulator [Hymenobacter convexus]|uniref:MarR family winged helix-turn-helix transcriptional regulator n=1 Tax=Hymenobacter sp. CA1UV-4 TaxID=3063782 RepID=UPI00271421DE|nr:MarR family transcriptional regulator [Hymenobacter sp. CA1UV-4]MDO7852213.1 MarR family transcriptional regulator [Hymenobacter sp. CA1UV-4]